MSMPSDATPSEPARMGSVMPPPPKRRNRTLLFLIGGASFVLIATVAASFLPFADNQMERITAAQIQVFVDQGYELCEADSWCGFATIAQPITRKTIFVGRVMVFDLEATATEDVAILAKTVFLNAKMKNVFFVGQSLCLGSHASIEALTGMGNHVTQPQLIQTNYLHRSDAK